jgi:hypothetical protein
MLDVVFRVASFAGMNPTTEALRKLVRGGLATAEPTSMVRRTSPVKALIV